MNHKLSQQAVRKKTKAFLTQGGTKQSGRSGIISISQGERDTVIYYFLFCGRSHPPFATQEWLLRIAMKLNF